MLRIEPRTLHTLSRHCTSELSSQHCLLFFVFLNNCYIHNCLTTVSYFFLNSKTFILTPQNNPMYVSVVTSNPRHTHTLHLVTATTLLKWMFCSHMFLMCSLTTSSLNDVKVLILIKPQSTLYIICFCFCLFFFFCGPGNLCLPLR